MASKKSRTKPPRGRPVSTSTISQHVVEEASYLNALSSFSPLGNLFAFLSLAVDKHRLRVYSTTSGQIMAEHIVDSARITALTWGVFEPSEGQNLLLDDSDMPSNKKKRKKTNTQPAEEPEKIKGSQVIILGLSDGTISLFAPTHGRILRTLSHPTSTAEIMSVVTASEDQSNTNVWTSGADGAIRVWDSQNNILLGSWKNDQMPYSSMAVRPGPPGMPAELLVANHSIQLLSTLSDVPDSHKYEQFATFTGHASSIRHLQWDSSQEPTPTRFLSIAERDRYVYIWQVPSTAQKKSSSQEGKIIASIPLDSDARSISLFLSRPPTLMSPSTSGRQTLLTLAASGKISVFPIPTDLVPPASSSRTQQHKIPTLLPRSTLSVASRKSFSTPVQLVGASFVPEKEGHICIARIIAGVRPVFDIVQYLDHAGEFIQDVIVDDVTTGLIDQSRLAAPNKRYTESSSVAVGSGTVLGQGETDDIVPGIIDGDLDVDLAELSLGQRLTALSGANPQPTSDDTDSETVPAAKQSKKSSNHSAKDDLSVVPANSLTRTLIQALHSSDSGLLETCLAHSDPSLIRNTVKRLPPQLAVPLITACAERLGRGARAGKMKGGGGGASSQRGSGLIIWIKTVLAVHSGHLMTIPDLVARLSGLYAILTSRLALQESLLSLSGRLDMVLSQIEMRSSLAPAPLVLQKDKERSDARAEVRYVEGESEDEQMDVEVEVDSKDDEGSVEDVELGGHSSVEEEEGSSEEENDTGEDEDDSDEDSDGLTMNGFIDDEAEEYSDEDEEDSQ